MSSVGRLMSVAAATALAAVTGADGAGSGPRTVAVVESAVFSVAQQGSLVAWRECNGVGVVDVARGTRRRAASPPSSVVQCQAAARSEGREQIVPRDGVAVARDLVAWTLFTQGNKEYVQAVTAELSSGRVHAKRELSLAGWRGEIVSDLAGDGDLILQGRVRRETARDCDDPDVWECDLTLVGGGVWSLGPRGERRLPGLPATTLVALAGRSVALAPQRSRTPAYTFDVGNGTVELWVLGQARRRWRTDVGGPVLALGLSARIVAAVVAGSPRTVVVLDAGSGRLLRTLPLPSSASSRLAVAGRSVFYAEGRSIRRLDAATGARTTVLRTRAAPDSLSAEGRRLAWVEARGPRSHVLTLTLPA